MKAITTAMIGALLAGSLGATAYADHDDRHPKQNEQWPVFLKIDDDVPADAMKKVLITADKAKQLALGVQQGLITELKLDVEGGMLVYQVEIFHNGDDEDVYVDAQTGQAWRENDQLRKQQLVKITEEEARKIALSKVSGTIVDVELDEEDGQYVYSMEIRTKKWQEAEIEISATTGEVLDMEWDD
ncbi:PepSY domain-containing protein [Brevibacillus migulae]|uniref:PepSY domain-containing protein n=1 Tax=Brevibacillus migulae TaxID=1644114 RepID=UPI00106E7CA8|nr:PepSY domain-containing protein [Brevibacillus migulae]